MIKIASFQYPIFEPYDSSTMEIYVAGCTRYCKQCHNPELQSFDSGKYISKEKIIKFLKERKDLFDNISFTGGDLLCQNIEEAYIFTNIIYEIFKKEKKFWLFTGEDNLNHIPDWCFKIFDFIKVGKYKPSLKQEGFPASTNQKLLIKGKDYK